MPNKSDSSPLELLVRVLKAMEADDDGPPADAFYRIGRLAWQARKTLLAPPADVHKLVDAVERISMMRTIEPESPLVAAMRQIAIEALAPETVDR